MEDLSGRVAVVSPHLDDAVLSCAEIISGLDDCVVLTVFTGSPSSWDVHRLWDNDICGFADGTNVVAARLLEDDAALGRLGASATRLGFLDEQYREPGTAPSAEEIRARMATAIEQVEATIALMPLGIGHNDHRLTAAACRRAAIEGSGVRWLVYLDLPYGYEPEIFGEGAVKEALDSLSPMVPMAIELGDGTGSEAKAAALDLYPSQMRGLGDRRWAAQKPERYWRLELASPAGRQATPDR